MKFSRLFSILTISIILFACGGNNETEATSENSTEQTEETMEVDLSDMEEISLDEYDLNAMMYVPNESKGKREIIFSEAGNIEIRIANSYGVEIVPFGMSVTEKKEELAGDLVYTTEYIEETENSILYSKSIKDSDIEPEIHFFLTVEIEGDLVEVKNLNEEVFSKGAIKKMMNSANSLKAKSTS